MEQSTQNLKQQVELYGEPLGEVVRRVTQALGLTQGGLAQVIGLSAPMLSQLVSAQRVKIGNPAVVSRLRAVSELADVAVADALLPERVAIELASIRSTTGAYTSATTNNHLRRPGGAAGEASSPAAGAPTPFAAPAGLSAERPVEAWHATYPDPLGRAELPARAVVRELQDLFRSVASADEIQRAAAAAAEESPAVAELLLAYGTGRTADALAHYEQHHG
ncbi:DNA-binding protein [Kribbella sp. NPDC051137]|uniref:helix-turn-helix domain-containing protein n=1 Tax=Kribbella sp. NPDC051137 TaxID=3155045 RepID=UPI002F85022F